jgi:pimeloyl-ACP methyl ester carboxylesterase
VNVTKEWLLASGESFSPARGRNGYAHLRHYTAEFCEWGEGRPLILVPGLAGSFELLGPLIRRLSRRFRVLSYHLRGEDDCFALRRSFGLADLADDLDEFIDWHCLERPIVFGVSFGGVVALEYAARHAAGLSHLIVQGVGARFKRGLLQQVAGSVLTRYPLPSDNPFINQFFNVLFGRRPEPGPLADFVVRSCWRTDQSVMAHRFRLVQGFDMTDRLHRVRVPTLLLAGDRDVIVSAASLQSLQNGIDECQVARLPDCGHLVCVTRPERVTEETIRFLAAGTGRHATA